MFEIKSPLDGVVEIRASLAPGSKLEPLESKSELRYKRLAKILERVPSSQGEEVRPFIEVSDIEEFDRIDQLKPIPVMTVTSHILKTAIAIEKRRVEAINTKISQLRGQLREQNDAVNLKHKDHPYLGKISLSPSSLDLQRNHSAAELQILQGKAYAASLNSQDFLSVEDRKNVVSHTEKIAKNSEILFQVRDSELRSDVIPDQIALLEHEHESQYLSLQMMIANVENGLIFVPQLSTLKEVKVLPRQYVVKGDVLFTVEV